MSRGSKRRIRKGRLRVVQPEHGRMYFVRDLTAEDPVAQARSLVTLNRSAYERLDRMLGWVEFPDAARWDLVWLGKYLVKFNEDNEMLPAVIEVIAELLGDAGMVVTFLGDQVLVR